MGKPRAEVVRFAVGGPDEPRSLVWRVWTTKGKSDLYISGRFRAATGRSVCTSRACGGSPSPKCFGRHTARKAPTG